MLSRLRCGRGSVKQTLKKALGAVLLALLLALAVSPLPFSLLFPWMHDKDSLRTLASDLNSQRTQAALDFFQQMPKRSMHELQDLSRPDAASYRFVIALITTGRQRPPHSPRDVGYVLQSAAAVASLVRNQQFFADTFFFVCNVDEHPHNYADAVYLQDFLPYAQRYGGSTVPNVTDLPIPGTEKLYRDTKHPTLFDAEVHDYNYCLQVAHSFRSKYYLVLQDDAVPCPEFSQVLELTLSKLTKTEQCMSSSSSSSRSSSKSSFKRSSDSSSSSSRRSSSSSSSSNDSNDSSRITSSSKRTSSSSTSTDSLLSYLLPSSEASCASDLPPYSTGLNLSPQRQRTISPSPDSSFAFIKFYFPERWQGFAFEPLRIVDLISVAAAGGGVWLILHAAWTFFRHKLLFPPAPSWRTFLTGVTVTLLLASIIGRQNVNELRRASKHLYRLQASPRCCIPAMLYPAPVMPFLITWLAESPEFHADKADESLVDLRIYDCFRHYQVPGYYVEPNIVHHVGMRSSLPKKDKKPVEEFLLSCW